MDAARRSAGHPAAAAVVAPDQRTRAMPSRPMMRTTHASALLMFLVGTALGGCSGGDFGRTREDFRNDDMHRWMGAEVTGSVGLKSSQFQLTENERAMRDLAYPLIEPPYDRQRWYSVLNEYGISRIWHHDWSRFDEQAYMRMLMGAVFRSETARYARLGDDIRNDRVRVPPFFQVAGRVIDMDRKREKNLAMVSYLTEREQFNAVARNAENALVISWVQWSLIARGVSYRVALERLAIAAPMPAASELDHSIVALGTLIDRYRVLPPPDVAPGPVGIGLPPFEGPGLPPPRRPLSVLGSAAPARPPSIETAALEPPASARTL
jgi:hypothetical protein